MVMMMMIMDVRNDNVLCDEMEWIHSMSSVDVDVNGCIAWSEKPTHHMNVIQSDVRVMANFSPGNDLIPGSSVLLPAQKELRRASAEWAIRVFRFGHAVIDFPR
jgi:hypothetical protein